MDRGAWWATVQGVTQSRTRQKQLSTHAGARVRELLCKGKWFFPLWLMALCREATQRIRRARFCCWPLPLLAVRNCSLALQKLWLCYLQCECQLPVLSFLAKEKERTQGKEKKKLVTFWRFFYVNVWGCIKLAREMFSLLFVVSWSLGLIIVSSQVRVLMNMVIFFLFWGWKRKVKL